MVSGCALLALVALVLMDWTGYVQTWFGALARAASGAALGWAISRYGLRLHLSELPDAQRPVAAISQALLISGCAIAVAVGV